MDARDWHGKDKGMLMVRNGEMGKGNDKSDFFWGESAYTTGNWLGS
jgi:hypothetical protein